MQSKASPKDLIDLMLSGQQFDTLHRALRLRISYPDGISDWVLLSQRVHGAESICGGLSYTILCVSASSDLPLKSFIGLAAELQFVTDTGELHSVCGLITEAASGQSDGGLATYQFTLRDVFSSVMALGVNTRVFIDKNEIEIVVQHLRRCIMIRTEDGRALTLRFADCLGLPVVATRWCVPGRDSALRDLPLPDRDQKPAPTPLALTTLQLEALAEATAPDEMLADIREMRHGLGMPGSGVEQHKWATEARQLWRTAENVVRLVLRWLTAAALDTRGAVLGQQQVLSLLKLQDTAAIRVGLNEAVTQAK